MPHPAPIWAATGVSTSRSPRPAAAFSRRRWPTTASRPSRCRPAAADDSLMKALVKTAPGIGNVSVCDVPTRPPGPGEAVVRIRRSGLCGTDLLVYDDAYRGRNRQVPYPLILGHEAS